MQNITRRAALMGTAAAVAVTATAAAAPALVSDPHAGWYRKSRDADAQANSLLSQLATTEDAILKELDSTYPAVIAAYDNGHLSYLTSLTNSHSIDTITLRRVLDRAKGKSDAEIDTLFRSERTAVIEQFKAREAKEAELEKATGFADLEAEALLHVRRANELEFKIADTPAKTLEGVQVQALVLYNWTKEGTPRRDPSSVELGTDEQEITALARRVADGLAMLSGTALQQHNA